MTRIILDLDDDQQLERKLARGDRPVKPAATFDATDQLGEIVIDNPPVNLFSGQLIADLRAVSAADEVTRSEGPAVILSRDLQEGVASLQRSGPGHATFANR